MGNIIFAEDIKNEDNHFSMSNGLTGVFFDSLVLSGTALAKTRREKELILWLAEHDQNVYGLGIVGFDLNRIPWTKEHFAREKQFLLDVLGGVKNKTGWELLPYEINEEELFGVLDDFCRLLNLFTEKFIREDAYKTWQESYRKTPCVLKFFPICSFHKTLVAKTGCIICNSDDAEPVFSDRGYEALEKATETEESYGVSQNSDGEVIFRVKARDDKPAEPEIFYAGGDEAFFYRTPGRFIQLLELAPDVRELLSKAEKVLIAEFPGKDADSDSAQYHAAVRQVKKLPYEDRYPLFKKLYETALKNKDKPLKEIIRGEDYLNLAAVLAREEDYGQLERYLAEGLPLNGTVDPLFISWASTPLYYITTRRIWAGMKEPAKMLKYLAAHGADPNYPAGDGSTPLENQSTGSGNVEIMKALLEAGADPDRADNKKKEYI